MSFYVIVGSGSTGTPLARLLAEEGERVRIVTRGGTGPEHPLIERVALDVNDTERMVELTQGASSLFNCVMPAYDRWPIDFPPIAASLLTVAERTGVGYLMVSNVYGYGPVDGPVTEDHPLAAETVKGRVRAQIWRDAHTAYEAGRVRVTEIRPSDFLGADAKSIFRIMVASKVLAGEPATVAASLDAPHTWTYTGDIARMLVALSRDERAWGRPWHVPSGRPRSVRELAERFAELAAAPTPELHELPLEALIEAGRESSLMRELPETQYMYREPFVTDATAAEQTFGLRATPLDDVLAEMIAAERAAVA